MKLKKLLAGVLTGALVLTLVNTNVGVAAETVTVSNAAWWDAWTPTYEIADGATLELTVTETVAGDYQWNSLNAAFVNVATDGETAPSADNYDGYAEYVVLRSDNWGWGTYYETTTYTGTDYLYMGDSIAMLDDDGNSIGTIDYKTLLTGAVYNVTISRSGTTIDYDYVITLSDDTVLNCGYEIVISELADTDSAYVFFTGDSGVTLTFEEAVSEDEETTEAATEEATETVSEETTEAATETVSEETTEAATETVSEETTEAATETTTEDTESVETETTESTEEVSEDTESVETEATESTEDVSEDTESTEAENTEAETTEAEDTEDVDDSESRSEDDYNVDADVIISDFCSVSTGELTLTGDFTVTYTFDTIGNLDGNDYYWTNFVARVIDSDYNNIFFRADNWSWVYESEPDLTYYCNNAVSDGTTIDWYTHTDYDGDWTEWLAAMTEGCSCTVTLTRSGNLFTAVMECGGTTFTISAEPDFIGDTVDVCLTGEQCAISNLVVEYSESSEDDTEDTTEVEPDDTATEETTESVDDGTVSGTGDDVKIYDPFSVHTGEVTLSGDFELTYTFHNVGDLTNDGWTYNNYIVEMHTADTVSTMAEGNYVFLDVRADNYGWWAYEAAGTEGIWFTSADVPADDDAWAAWLEAMQEGVDVTVNIVRSGNTITVTSTAAGYTFVAVATTEDFEDQDLVIYLTGEQCELTNVSYTYQLLSGEETPEEVTEDTEAETTEAVDTEAETTEAVDTEAEVTEATDTESNDTDTATTEAEVTEATDTESDDTETATTEAADTAATDTESEDTEDEAASGTLTATSSDGSMYYAITIDSADSDSYLIVEVSDGSGAYIYADSNGTCYFVSADGEITEITDYEGDILSLSSGEVYTVTVDYDGSDVVISFYNEDGEVVLAYTVSDTGMDDEITTTLSASDDAVITIDDAAVETANDGENGTEEGANTEDDTDSAATGNTESSNSSNVISTGDSSSATTGSNASPKTGDASPIIPITVAILGCAAVVFASKKRMA